MAKTYGELTPEEHMRLADIVLDREPAEPGSEDEKLRLLFAGMRKEVWRELEEEE